MAWGDWLNCSTSDPPVQISRIALISTRGLGFRYGDRTILAEVGLTTRPGAVVGLIGPNGSGKSTLLRCLYGALRPCVGNVSLDDLDIGQYTTGEVARRVGVVPQDATTGLGMTVAESVLLGRSPHRRDHQPYTVEDRQIVADALEQVGAVSLAARPVTELSGGERQRVLIARCLAQKSEILLLDEPTNHLDVRYQHDILGLVRALRLTSVIVLHDLNLAARYCDHLVLLQHGVVVADGDVQTVLDPGILRQVYEIDVRRIDVAGELVLMFGPNVGGVAATAETTSRQH
jgi:iron complex transport system ATP-binding protein